MVGEYTKRSLSFGSDRLAAISGVVSRLSTLLDDVYIAGIWKKDILKCLQWQYKYGRGPQIHSSVYRAPSWSWASLETPSPTSTELATTFSPSGAFYDHEVDEQHRPEVSVVNLSWKHQNNITYGDLESAQLELLGRPLRGNVYLSTQGPDRDAQYCTMTEHLEEPALLTPDQSGTSEPAPIGRELWYIHVGGRTIAQQYSRIIARVQPDAWDEMEQGIAYLLPLASRRFGGTQDDFCLILNETNTGVFKRVGYCRANPNFIPKAQQVSMTLI
jgi:hypothetical protein